MGREVEGDEHEQVKGRRVVSWLGVQTGWLGRGQCLDGARGVGCSGTVARQPVGDGDRRCGEQQDRADVLLSYFSNGGFGLECDECTV